SGSTQSATYITRAFGLSQDFPQVRTLPLTTTIAVTTLNSCMPLPFFGALSSHYDCEITLKEACKAMLQLYTWGPIRPLEKYASDHTITCLGGGRLNATQSDGPRAGRKDSLRQVLKTLNAGRSCEGGWLLHAAESELTKKGSSENELNLNSPNGSVLLKTAQ
ncbi:hypothetical protein BDZ94DRAFT_1347243, partial [Collybia nuda]